MVISFPYLPRDEVPLTAPSGSARQVLKAWSFSFFQACLEYTTHATHAGVSTCSCYLMVFGQFQLHVSTVSRTLFSAKLKPSKQHSELVGVCFFRMWQHTSKEPALELEKHEKMHFLVVPWFAGVEFEICYRYLQVLYL